MGFLSPCGKWLIRPTGSALVCQRRNGGLLSGGIDQRKTASGVRRSATAAVVNLPALQLASAVPFTDQIRDSAAFSQVCLPPLAPV